MKGRCFRNKSLQVVIARTYTGTPIDLGQLIKEGSQVSGSLCILESPFQLLNFQFHIHKTRICLNYLMKTNPMTFPYQSWTPISSPKTPRNGELLIKEIYLLKTYRLRCSDPKSV